MKHNTKNVDNEYYSLDLCQYIVKKQLPYASFFTTLVSPEKKTHIYESPKN